MDTFYFAWKKLVERIEEKTTWGRNELKDLMLQCLLQDDTVHQVSLPDIG